MFDCAELLARHQPPKGDRLAIVTNAGGPGVMTTDHLLATMGRLAKLSPETMAKLNEFLPVCWSHGNPVDILGDAPPDRYAKTVDIVLQDPEVDAVLVILTPQAMTDSTGAARALIQGVGKNTKPVLAAWMGGHTVAEGTRLLDQAGIPTYDTPEKAVRAFMHLVSYARNLEILHETPREIPLAFALDRQRRAGAVRHDPERRARRPLGERLQDAAGRLRDPGHQAGDRPHRRKTPWPWRSRSAIPVVMKIHSPQITHKTDVGGVVLNLASDEAVAQRLREDDRAGQGEAARRHDPRRDDPEDGRHSQRLRVDHGHEEGPDFRRGHPGGHGRRGGRGLQGPGAGPAAAERNARPPRPGIAQVLAACCADTAASRR